MIFLYRILLLFAPLLFSHLRLDCVLLTHITIVSVLKGLADTQRYLVETKVVTN